MKTELQKYLATIAPQISIVTLWEHDPDGYQEFKGLSQPGNCMEGQDFRDWQSWQTEIRATTVSLGETLTGTAYLGGTWERSSNDPTETNPEISGYELQMTEEALEELRREIGEAAPLLWSQCTAALEWLRAEALRRYDEQRGSVATA